MTILKGRRAFWRAFPFFPVCFPGFFTQSPKLFGFFSFFNDFHYGIFSKKEYDVKEPILLMQAMPSVDKGACVFLSTEGMVLLLYKYTT